MSMLDVLGALYSYVVVPPPWVALLAIAWAFYSNFRGAAWTWKNERSSTDVLYQRISIMVLLVFYAVAYMLIWILALAPAQVLALVSPLNPLLFIVVAGLPAHIYRRKNIARRALVDTALDASLKTLKEIGTDEPC
jgi:hypothetical protein